MTRTSLALALILMAAVGASWAGIGQGNGEIGFDFGYTDFDPDYSFGGGTRLAFRGGYHVTDLFEIEGQTSAAIHFGPSYTTYRPARVLYSALINAVFNFHPGEGAVVPYVLAGMGRARLDLTAGGPHDDGSAWQVAAGCRFFFGDDRQAAFRLEYARLTADPFDFRATHQSVTAGFAWRIGAAR